jgi:hypothetical protein
LRLRLLRTLVAPASLATQIQIGQQLGISQMQVSRLIAKALGYLRPRVLGLDERTAATTVPPRLYGRAQGSSADIYNVAR